MKKVIASLLLTLSMFASLEASAIKVGLCAAYPPFESRDAKSGKIVGFDIDLAKEIGKIINKEIIIKDAEWQALLGGLKNKHYDVIISAMSAREAGKGNVNISDTYYLLNDVIVVKKSDSSIRSQKDLKNKSVGVQLGSGSEQIVDKLKGLKKVARYNYNPEAFLDLKLGRIDAVVVGYAYAINQKNFKKEFKISGTLAPAELVAVMRKGDDSLTKEINEALKTLKANGTYDKLVQKWLVVK